MTSSSSVKGERGDSPSASPPEMLREELQLWSVLGVFKEFDASSRIPRLLFLIPALWPLRWHGWERYRWDWSLETVERAFLPSWDIDSNDGRSWRRHPRFGEGGITVLGPVFDGRFFLLKLAMCLLFFFLTAHVTFTWRVHVVMASRRTFQYCGHCEQSVSLKTFKEHQRLYFYDGRWIKQRDMRSEGARSRSSSPLTISDPPTPIITNFSDIEEDAESTGRCDTITYLAIRCLATLFL